MSAGTSAICTPAMFVLWTFSFIWPWLLAVLAFLLLLSGLDDFIPVLICALGRLRSAGPQHSHTNLDADAVERRIAIFVPCWKESEVIEGMVRNNLARIRYRNFDFFLGVYPNDQPTCDAALDVAASFPNVHVAVCPGAGPTSKADCLNAIYNGMRTFEAGNGVRFDTIVLHDAEDVIHADALNVINQQRTRHAMVQVPVLPLPTPPAEFTHGIYCDEFSEFQIIDMRARQCSGSFVPSNGVGTGFARDVLEALAAQRGGMIFDPSSLTEDYEIGVQIHAASYSQIFCPLQRGPRGIIATREYFPRKLRSAIRQRTRWITGIALQTWERHGWQGSWRTKYWFWRDRKGLLTNPLSLLTNVLFLAGLTDWLVSRLVHRPWAFAVSNAWVVELCLFTLCLQVFRLLLRSLCVGRIFGVGMGLTVTLRCLYANYINCAASLGAVTKYAISRLRRTTLRWDKTDHAYPVRAAQDPHRLNLEEVLVSRGYLSQESAETVRLLLPEGAELADFLLTNQLVGEDDLCRALSLQSGLPWSDVNVTQVKPEVLRSVPLAVQDRFRVIPFRVSAGRLHLAATRVPETHVFETLNRFTQLAIQFEIVTSANYAQLRALLTS